MAPEVPNFSGHHNGPGLFQSTLQRLRTQDPPTNPNNNPNNRLNFNGDGQHRPKNERAMEKFRQVVMKIAEISGANTTPAAAAAQKNLIEQRLSDFFSNFHTPNHPPYAAMIQKAIQELNEKGGSSEELISNYIEKEYNDLPWAHSTFLKHHLSKLCEYGEISMTRKGSYLLGGTKPKREDLKRKRKSRSQSARGRSRGRKKEETNEEDDDQQNGLPYDEAIEGYKSIQEEMIENENEPEKEEIRLVEEQNLAFELPNGVIQEQNVVFLDSVMDLYTVPIQLQEPELSVLETTKELEHVMVEQISEQDNSLIQGQTEPQNEGPAELDGQYIPPESESTLETTLTHPVNLDSIEKEEDEKLPNSVEKSEEGNKFQADSEKLDLPVNSEPGIGDSSIGLCMDAKQIDEEQQPNISCKTDRERRQHKRWSQSLPKVKPPASIPSHSKDQHALQEKQPSAERPEKLKETPLENGVIQDEGKNQQGKEESRIGVEQSQPHAVNFYMLEKDLPNLGMPTEVDVMGLKKSSLTLHEIMEDQQSKRQLRSHSAHKSSTFIEEQLLELSTQEKPTELKLATTNSLTHEPQQQADTSGGHKAEVPEPPAIDKLSQTGSGKRQVRRSPRTLAVAKQAAANSLQTEVTNLQSPKELKENPGEKSTPITDQRAKLRSSQKQNKPQSTVETCSVDLPLALETKLDLPERSAEGEPVEDSSDPPVGELIRTDHQTLDVRDQLPHRGRGRGRGRPREPKPDMPVGELTITDTQNPCVQGEPAQRGRGRGRPPKQKPDSPVGELTMGTKHQNPSVQEQPPRRGRGRPKRGQGMP